MSVTSQTLLCLVCFSLVFGLSHRRRWPIVTQAHTHVFCDLCSYAKCSLSSWIRLFCVCFLYISVMSASQQALMRRVHRPLPGPASPQEGGAESSLPCHTPARDSDERFDSVLLSSRSTASLNRIPSPSGITKGSAFAEAPLSHSPQVPLRSGNTGKTAAGATDAPWRTQRVGTSASSEEAGAGSRSRDVHLAVRATPERAAARCIIDGANNSPTSQQRSSVDEKMTDSVLRPVEDSVSFEFYNHHHHHHHHPPQHPQPQQLSTARRHGSSHNRPTTTTTSATDSRTSRGIAGYPCRESPMAPNKLPIVPIPDSFSQRCTMSISLRDQHGDGRYAAMSQSSRLDEARQYSPRTLDGDDSLLDPAARRHIPLLDDMVRNSTTESFVAEDAAGQPPRVDASLTSQNFIRNYKRRHTTPGNGGRSGGGGGGRYGSTSMSGSPRVSADAVAARPAGSAAPELLSSDQLTRMPTVHGKRRGRKSTGAEAEDIPRGRHDSDVLGSPAAATFLRAGDASLSYSPPVDEFAAVRAPVSGLRAKVLGNTVIDEDEAAENPEVQALLTQQIERFVSKVVRQQHGGGGTAGGDSPCATGLDETRAEILRRANAEAAAATADSINRDEQKTAVRQPLTEGVAEISTNPAVARRLRNASKRVRFDLGGLVPRDGDGPDALRMPRHSGSAQRSSSPPAAPTVQDTNDSERTPRITPQVVDVRSLLRAGVCENEISFPATPVRDTAAEEEEVVVVISTAAPTPTHLASADRVAPPQESFRSSVDGSDQPRCTPLSPQSVAAPSAAATPSAKGVPAPPATSAQEPQQRRKSAGKIRKATKMHRKAAVALVSGASESVVVSRSSTSSSVRQSQLTPLRGPQMSPYQSVEGSTTEAGSTSIPPSPRPPLPGSLSNPVFLTAAAPDATAAAATIPTGVDSDFGTPTHRIHIAGLQSHSPKAGAAPTPVPAAATPPPLHTTQVVPPRPGPDGCGKARRRRTSTGGSHKGATATAPSSRRSSLPLAAVPPTKSDTYMELPALSATSHSCTSTPDVVAPPGTTGDTTATPSLAGEVQVLLPAAILRRLAVPQDGVVPAHSASEYVGGATATAGQRRERSGSVAEMQGERGLSPASTASQKSTAGRPSKAQVVQLSTHALPRLSSSSLKSRSVSQTISPPSAAQEREEEPSAANSRRDVRR